MYHFEAPQYRKPRKALKSSCRFHHLTRKGQEGGQVPLQNTFFIIACFKSRSMKGLEEPQRFQTTGVT